MWPEKFLSLLLVLALYSSTDAFAQTNDSLFGKSLEDVLNMQVSTASKLGSTLGDAPGNMTVIPHEEIERFGYRTIGDALQRVPGFGFGDNGFYSLVAFRGIRPQSYTTNSRVLILIDGVRYNDSAYDNADLNEVFPLDIESVDRIEVLKGAGSAMWGSNALYAVVNVISKKGDGTQSSKIMGEYASYNRKKGYASLGGTTGGGVKYFSSLSATDRDMTTNVYFPAQKGSPDNNGVVSGSYTRRDYRGNVKASYDDFYGSLVYGFDKTAMDYSMILGSSDESTLNFRQMPVQGEVGYKYKLWPEQNGEVSARVFALNTPYRKSDRYPGINPDSPADFFGSIYFQKVKTSGGEARYSQDLSGVLKGIVGVEYLQDSVGFTNRGAVYLGDGSLVAGTESETVFDFSRDTYSPYFDLVYSPTEKIKLFLGGRSDKATNQERIFGPRASIVAHPVSDTTLKLMYSQGFRNPSVGESLIYQPSPQRLVAEELNFYECLVEQKLSDWGTLTGSVFYNNLSDIIGYSFYADNNSYYTNFEGFTSRGVEIELKAKMSEGVQGFVNYTHTSARNKDLDSKLTDYPSDVGRAGLSFGYKDWIIASPEIMYGGLTETENGYRFNRYVIANLTILRRPITKGLDIAASLYNVFDKDYAILSGGYQENSRALENGRQFRVQASWQF